MNVFQNNMKIYFTEYYFQEITNIHFIVLIIIIIMILILIIKKIDNYFFIKKCI